MNERWFHLAIVNDGRLGAGHYANTVDQGFAGHIGELRIVTRPLEPSQFLNA